MTVPISAGAYDGVSDYDLKRTAYLMVRGPLVSSAGSPVYKHPLAVTGNMRGISDVYLMNNDGGGNLNLQFDFLGTQNAHSRVSVSSLLPNTAYAKTVVETAQQMPQVQQQEVADQQDSVGEEPIPEPADLN